MEMVIWHAHTILFNVISSKNISSKVEKAYSQLLIFEIFSLSITHMVYMFFFLFNSVFVYIYLVGQHEAVEPKLTTFIYLFIHLVFNVLYDLK